METNKLWIIPRDAIEPVLYGNPSESADHQIHCHDFCLKNKIDDSYCSSHNDYATLFASLGMVVVFNSGRKMDGYYFCSIFLPEHCTENQINFFLANKDLFNEQFYHTPSFFNTSVYTTKPLPYKNTLAHFRSLKIETIINNENCQDGQTLLYNELAKHQTEKLNR